MFLLTVLTLEVGPAKMSALETADRVSHQDITTLLHAWGGGDLVARDQVLELVYRELRARAAVQLRRERRDHTLQPIRTASSGRTALSSLG